MFLNQFSVRVLGGKEQPGGYVEMEHGSKYRLVLRNERAVRCEAHVEIDGKHVGTWRLVAHGSLSLERPAHDPSCFTFYQSGTVEAKQAQLQEGAPDLGLVKVTFTPERVPDVKPLPGYHLVDDFLMTYPCSATGVPVADSALASRTLTASLGAPAAASCYAGGGTGLSGHSNQTFITVASLDLDFSQQTVIHLRLVAKSTSETPRPLTSYSTPVPPAVR